VIVGLDRFEPAVQLERTEYVRSDESYSILARIVKAARIDTIVHTFLAVDSTMMASRTIHEINVIGTMNLFAAASAPASTVRNVVVKSSTLVYGASPKDPVWFSEEARRAVATEERQSAGAGEKGNLTSAQRERIVQAVIGKFYADFFFWVSLVGAAVQLFLVSRILKHVGVSGALFFLPVISLAGYSMIAFFPVLGYIQVAKIFENSTDYSLQNTARQALFLPTSRETKYKAKAAIDTFFVRMGDVLSSVVVFIGTYWLLNTKTFAMINVALVAVWLLLVAVIGRHYKKLTLAEVKATA